MTDLSRRSLIGFSGASLAGIALAGAGLSSGASAATKTRFLQAASLTSTDAHSLINGIPVDATHPEVGLWGIAYGQRAKGTIGSMVATIALPTKKNAVLKLSNGAHTELAPGQSNWSIPSGPTGTVRLNGVACNVYTFTNSTPITLDQAADYDGAPLHFAQVTGPFVQVVSGGGSLTASSPLRVTISATIGQRTIQHTSAIGTIEAPPVAFGDVIF